MQDSDYMLSRNFSLQTVGDLNWIKEHYHFDTIAFSIDELIVLNVNREEKDIERFSRNLIELNKNCFMPIAAGGGIRRIEDAYALLNAGADKIVINSAVINQPELVVSLVKTFGSQCVVASIDYKMAGDNIEVFISDGSHPTGLSVNEVIETTQKLGCGEIYLTSMDKDGTGEGLDLELIRQITDIVKVPLIASGGVGKYGHFAEGVLKSKAEAVSTANLFNFIEDGLKEARLTMQEQGIEMASWDFGFHNIICKGNAI
tara:strand:+ start:17574 stop:18350 length:777 start_codon:yes stop_codon:yes gene_type:complete